MVGRVLIACEESQTVTIAMRELGINAYSCDTRPCSGGHPEWHLHRKVQGLLHMRWDMVIAFPPCTHLASSGARWFKEKIADGRQQRGIDFFMLFTKLSCPWAIENPVGIMSTHYRKPDQIIHPWMFGEPVEKSTCLWLKDLPKLKSTSIVKPPLRRRFASGNVMSAWYNDTWRLPSRERAKIRSKTFLGIAKAMADQWGRLLLPK